MSAPYRAAIREHLPHATIVADRFHHDVTEVGFQRLDVLNLIEVGGVGDDVIFGELHQFATAQQVGS